MAANDDSDYESFEDALDAGAYEQWVVADDIVADRPDVESDSFDRYQVGHSRSRSGGASSSGDYLTQFVSVFPTNGDDGRDSYVSSSDEDLSHDSRSSSSLSFAPNRHDNRWAASTAAGAPAPADIWTRDQDEQYVPATPLTQSEPFVDADSDDSDDRTDPSFQRSQQRALPFVPDNFKSTKIQMHPSRIAVHPVSGNRYHIADYVLLFPDEPHLSLSDIQRRGVQLPRAHTSTPRNDDARTPKSSSRPATAGSTRKDSQRRRGRSAAKSRSRSRGGSGNGSQNSAGGSDGEDSNGGAKLSTNADDQLTPVAETALPTPKHESGTPKSNLTRVNDHPDAVQVQLVKRSLHDVHGLRLMQELNTRSGLIWCVSVRVFRDLSWTAV